MQIVIFKFSIKCKNILSMEEILKWYKNIVWSLIGSIFKNLLEMIK